MQTAVEPALAKVKSTCPELIATSDARGILVELFERRSLVLLQSVMDSLTPGRIHFSTDALPQRDRFPVFYEEIIRPFTGLELITQEPLQFHANIEFARFGAIAVNHAYNTALDCMRTPKLVGDGDDTLCLMLLESGSGYHTQGGSDQKLGPGEASICDSGYPGEYNFTANAESWCVKFTRPKLAKLLPARTRFAGAKLDGNAAARRLLFSYMRATFNMSLGPGEPATGLVEDHIVDLVALALGADGDARATAKERGARAARRSAVLRAIGSRSGDPHLSAAAIAAVLGVTPRYVHLLLEETGKSFGHHLLERRLETAAALLRDPRYQDRRIIDIATEAGFADLSYFGRCFRRHYGATPSDIRETARRGRGEH